MDFRCVCGKVLSMEVAPGAIVRCPACGQTIQVPGAPTPHPPAGPPGPPSPFMGGPMGPAAYPGPAAPRTSGVAVAALVLGLTSLLLGPLTGVVAIILGIVALVKTSRSQGQVSGKGLAIAGLVLGVVLSVVPIVVVVSALGEARGYARKASCASNLRQLGIGITNYAVEQDDKMPPGDLNMFHHLADYLGESTFGPGGSDVFRCAMHPWLPEQDQELYCSYAFNISLDEEANDRYCPFSLKSTGRLRRLGGTASDTILAIEMWMRPRPDGTFPNQLRLDEPDWSPIQAGVVPISSYEADESATFDRRGRLVDPGPYRFLDCYKGTNVSVDRMYHQGKINVLHADGHVAQISIRELTSLPPNRDARWTRLRD